MAKKIISVLPYFVIGLLVTAYFVASLPQSPGISPDSVQYLLAAQNLAKGGGLGVIQADSTYVPLTHFPPLYPFLVSLLIKGNYDGRALILLRDCNLILLLANGALISILVFMTTQRNSLAILTNIVFLSAPVILSIHGMAWTEPLFLLFILLTFLLLSNTKPTGPEWAYIIPAALACGAALLTRYAGIALLLSMGIWLLGQTRKTDKAVKKTIVFVGLSVLPMGLWILFRDIPKNTLAGERSISWHPPGLLQLKNGIETIGSWLNPFSSSLSLIIGILAAVCFIRYFVMNYACDELLGSSRARSLKNLCRYFIISYLVIILVSISLFDAEVSLNNRILSPLVPPALLLLMISISTKDHSKLWSRLTVRNFIILLALLTALVQSPLLNRNDWDRKLFYASKTWLNSPTIQQVSKIQVGASIASNAPDALHLLTDRSAYSLPSLLNPGSRKNNPHYQTQLNELYDLLERNSGYIIYFRTAKWRYYLPSENDLMQSKLTKVWEGSDGAIYSVKKAPA